MNNMPRRPPADEGALVPLFVRRPDGKAERIYVRDLAEHLFVTTVRIFKLAARCGRVNGYIEGWFWVTVETAARIIIAQRAADGAEVQLEGKGRGPASKRKLCPFVRRARIRAKDKRVNARRAGIPR